MDGGRPSSSSIFRGSGSVLDKLMPETTKMRISGLVVTLALWTAGTGVNAAVPAGPFAGCLSQLRSAPAAKDGARCFYLVGQENGSWKQARTEMAPLLQEYPDHPWLQHYYAHVLGEVDPEAPELDHLYLAAAEGFSQRRLTSDPADDATIRQWMMGEIFARREVHERWLERHRLEDARGQLDRLQAALGDVQDEEIRARLLIMEGHQLLYERRDLGRAWNLLRDAELLLPQNASPKPWGDLLITISAVSLELGRHLQARSYTERAIRLAQVNGELSVEAAARTNLLFALVGLHKKQPASISREMLLQQVREAVDVADRSTHLVARAKAHLELARLSPVREAEPHFAACIEAAGEANDLFTQAECYVNRALKWTDLDPDKARRLREDALRLARRSDDRTRAYVEAMAARVCWQIGDKEGALRSLAASFETLETLRRRQSADQGRARLFSEWADNNQVFIGLLLEEFERTGDARHLERAFDLSERIRSRVLQEAVGADLPLPRGSGEPEFVTLAEVQGTLEPNEAMLLYQSAPEHDVYGQPAGGSWLIVVTRDGVRSYPLRDSRTLLYAVPSLLDLLKQRTEAVSMAPPAAKLHAELLAPALENLPDRVDSLILIPDGVLHSLPFAFLGDGSGDTLLADRFDMSRIPSATLWLRWRESERPPAALPALVLADPQLPYTDLRQALAFASTRGASTSQSLGPLPLARLEGQGIVRHLGSKVLLRQGAGATESMMKSGRLHRFGIVHLAAHAKADHGDPESATIFLAPEEPAEDGLLQFKEIVDLDLTGRTVVLSACDTASGEVLLGEGVLDLAHAFFRAGAHAVVASLWPLRDDDGQLFFDAFYRHLARGESLAGAARAAQRERIAEGAPPAAWAGIVVLGDGSLVPFPDPPVRVPLPLALLLCLGLLGAAVAVVAYRARAVSATGG